MVIREYGAYRSKNIAMNLNQLHTRASRIANLLSRLSYQDIVITDY